MHKFLQVIFKRDNKVAEARIDVARKSTNELVAGTDKFLQTISQLIERNEIVTNRKNRNVQKPKPQ